MPQKRNPVVLEHLRLPQPLGQAQSVAIQCHNIPYGDTQDIEDEIWPPVVASAAALQESLQLYTAVFDTLELNREHLRRRAGQGFTTATELADALAREAGLPFRQAHRIVAARAPLPPASRRLTTLDMVRSPQRLRPRLPSAEAGAVGGALTRSAYRCTHPACGVASPPPRPCPTPRPGPRRRRLARLPTPARSRRVECRVYR